MAHALVFTVLCIAHIASTQLATESEGLEKDEAEFKTSAALAPYDLRTLMKRQTRDALEGLPSGPPSGPHPPDEESKLKERPVLENNGTRPFEKSPRRNAFSSRSITGCRNQSESGSQSGETRSQRRFRRGTDKETNQEQREENQRRRNSRHTCRNRNRRPNSGEEITEEEEDTKKTTWRIPSQQRPRGWQRATRSSMTSTNRSTSAGPSIGEEDEEDVQDEEAGSEEWDDE